jgi:hypothetical protein
MPKVQRVGYRLDARGIEHLADEEIRVILRGADDLIMSGGRTLLAQILKGARTKKVLELGLHKSPAYGYYRHLSQGAVLARIDWTIQSGYLAIAYDRRLPLLVYTPRGWEIERETYAEELFRGFDALLATGGPYDMEYLKDRNRSMILLLLDKVEASGDPKYIPLLKDWARIDYKKVRQQISQVIERLEGV